MALPALTKTWQLDPNNVIAMDASETVYGQKMMYQLYTMMTGFGSNPWVAVASCDGSTAGWPGPGWSSYLSCVWSTGVHSWVVYEFADGQQLLFDLDYSSGNSENANVRVSPGGLYTGGDTSNPPTATDEEYILTGSNGSHTDTKWSGYCSGFNWATQNTVIHAWLSDDGLEARIQFWKNGYCRAAYYFGDMADKRDNQTDPFMWGALVRFSSSDGDVVGNLWMDQGWLKSIHSSSLYRMNLLTYGSGTKPWIEFVTSAALPEEIDNIYHATPWVLWCFNDVGARGFKGAMVDLWTSPYQAFGKGDNSPNTPAARDYVHCEYCCLPWTGDSTVMLIS